MSDATNRWADELAESFGVLKAMRDELRVQLHLGNMDAKARFAELEHRLDSEQLTARKNLNELIASFRVLKQELGNQAH